MSKILNHPFKQIVKNENSAFTHTHTHIVFIEESHEFGLEHHGE